MVVEFVLGSICLFSAIFLAMVITVLIRRRGSVRPQGDLQQAPTTKVGDSESTVGSLLNAFGALAKAGMMLLLIGFSIWVLLVMHSCS